MVEKLHLTVLIAESNPAISEIITNLLTTAGHNVFCAVDGEDCLQLFQELKPDIAFIGIKLSKVHGLDIIRAVRSDALLSQTALIVCTTRALIQDYQMCIEAGIDYYLVKPFAPTIILELVQKYRNGVLYPAVFALPYYPEIIAKDFFTTPREQTGDYLKFWGTRGSTPVSGAIYQYHGGDTSCLEINSQQQVLIIDAGTGIQNLGKALLKTAAREVHLVIGHTHWDHIIGFPFFAPAYHADFTINIYAAHGFKKNVKQLFSGMLDYDYFPVCLEEMRAKLNFFELDRTPLQIGGIKLRYIFANHPGATLCFKIETSTQQIGYATDNELFVAYHGHPNEITEEHILLKSYQGIIDFYRGCDILIHEAQYISEDYRTKVGWGHSSISNAALLMRCCKPKEWIFTHHDPAHNDEMLQNKLRMHRAILNQCNVDCYVNKAYDGLKISI